MKKEPFGLFISKLILNVTFIIYIGIVLGLISMAYFSPLRYQPNSNIGKTPKTEAPEMSNNDADSGLAVYGNEKYGFEFNYPKGWEVEDLTNDPFYNSGEEKSLLMLGVEGDDINAGAFWIEIKEGNSTDKTISEYMDNYCVVGGGISREEKISVGGIDGKSVYFNDFCETGEEIPWIFIAYQSKVYIFGTPLGANYNGKFFNTVVSSFKFKNSDVNGDGADKNTL